MFGNDVSMLSAIWTASLPVYTGTRLTTSTPRLSVETRVVKGVDSDDHRCSIWPLFHETKDCRGEQSVGSEGTVTMTQYISDAWKRCTSLFGQ